MSDFVLDSFTGTPGTQLNARAGETGATWAIGATLGNSSLKIDSTGERVVSNNDSSNSYFYASGQAPQDGSFCEIEYDVLTNVNSIGAMVRAAANKGYHLLVTASSFSVRRLDGDTFTALVMDGGTSTALTHANGTAHKMKISAEGIGASVVVKVYFDDVLKGTVTDTSTNRVVTLGSVGLTAYGAYNDNVGLHMKSIRGAIPVAAASAVDLTGPTTGSVGIASSLFSVTANGSITGSEVITLSDGGAGGAFSVGAVTLSDSNPTANFRYTPAVAGAATITATSDGTLIGDSMVYTAAARTVTKRLVTSGGVARASLSGLKWAFFDQSTPNLFAAPVAKGVGETTDSAGDIVIAIPGTTLPLGGTGWLIVTDSDGTVSGTAKVYSGPVAVA